MIHTYINVFHEFQILTYIKKNYNERVIKTKKKKEKEKQMKRQDNFQS